MSEERGVWEYGRYEEERGMCEYGREEARERNMGIWKRGYCSDVWENLMPVNMLSICYNCSSTQLIKAPHKLSL